MTRGLAFLAYIVTVPCFVAWLLFCAVLALIGVPLPYRHIPIDLNRVKKKMTVCRVLFLKGLLSEEEYAFETNEVAAGYDELTFQGYLFILGPIIFLLMHVQFLDRFVLFVVHKWMHIHRFEKEMDQKPNTFFAGLAKVCVAIAGAVGQVLFRVGWVNN